MDPAKRECRRRMPTTTDARRPEMGWVASRSAAMSSYSLAGLAHPELLWQVVVEVHASNASSLQVCLILVVAFYRIAS